MRATQQVKLMYHPCRMGRMNPNPEASLYWGSISDLTLRHPKFLALFLYGTNWSRFPISDQAALHQGALWPVGKMAWQDHVQQRRQWLELLRRLWQPWFLCEEHEVAVRWKLAKGNWLFEANGWLLCKNDLSWSPSLVFWDCTFLISQVSQSSKTWQ